MIENFSWQLIVMKMGCVAPRSQASDWTQKKGFAHKREVAKVVKAWNMAKAQSEVKVKADAAARAHGVPITMLEPDWASHMDFFQEQVRQPYPDQRSHSSSLANGTLKGITLAHVVSAKEQEAEDEARPEPSRQMGLHLDSTLTIQMKRRYMSAMLSSTEELRQKIPHYDQLLVARSNAAASPASLLRPYSARISDFL